TSRTGPTQDKAIFVKTDAMLGPFMRPAYSSAADLAITGAGLTVEVMGRKMKRWEAAIVIRGVVPAKRYLDRLHARRCAEAFDRDDEIFKAVIAANDAVHSLWVKLHYRSCRNAFSDWDPELDGTPPGRPLLLTFRS